MFHVRTCHKTYHVLYTHTTLCSTWENAIKCILSCKHAIPLYFTCECARRRILSFTHSLRLYYIRQTLLNSKTIWWYRQHVVCARIWYCEIFCAIPYISARSLRIAYGRYSSITSSTTTTITIYTIISAPLWTSPGSFP